MLIKRFQEKDTMKISMNCQKIVFCSVIFFCSFLFGENLVAQTKVKTISAPSQTRILFLFDASQSMYGRWQSGSKIEVAKKLMNELLDSLMTVDNVQLALRCYGHQKPYPPQDCDDTKLEVPFEKGNISRIKQVINSIRPSGTTPIARSLEASANDFPDLNARNIILLITDGVEECKGDPCAISAALQRKGVFLKPFVIGMGIDESFKKTFECVGNYFDATDEVQFKNALNIVISQALNNTTLQVNLLDQSGNPTETNVNMTFYDQSTGRMRYNYIHTLNSKGNPDTLVIDPLSTYRIVAHTIPPVEIKDVKLTPGKHTIAGIDAPQGFLSLKFQGMAEYKKLQAIVRKHDEMQTLIVQDFNTTEKYITGKYDLEIMTLPRIYYNSIDIAQSKTTTMQIPQPGLVSFITTGQGFGSLYIDSGTNLDWIYNLDDNLTRETVVLQPGQYRVVFRPKNSKESIYTEEQKFTVKSGESTIVNLN